MLVLLLLIALLHPIRTWAQSASLGIDAGSGVRTIEVNRGRDHAVFSLSALEPLGGTATVDARSARITLFDLTLTFEFGSPFFKAGNDIFQLCIPARRSGGSAFVSTQLITDWLPARFPDKLTLRDGVLRTNRPRAVTEPVPGSAASPVPKRQRIVIIDAGHGGRDAGKIGPNGLAEKTVTLTIANKLAALLQERGYEVHLTRSSDTLIALADRPRLANQWKNGRPSALFISIHANAGASQAEGYETYFLSEARTDDERRVAEMENAAVAFEEHATKGPAIEQLLTDLRNDFYQRASNDLAETIQRELSSFHPGRSRGVKQAGFRVLVGAFMPAVLAEIAFISNPAEARLLGAAAFQEKIAWSLSRSIVSFFDSHEHLWLNNAGTR